MQIENNIDAGSKFIISFDYVNSGRIENIGLRKKSDVKKFRNEFAVGYWKINLKRK